MFRLFILLTSFISTFAFADYKSDFQDRLNKASANISIMKSQATPLATDLYIFKFCVNGTLPKDCETIGSEEGYTLEEIQQLGGRWKQAGAVVLGAGETVVGVVAGVYIGAFTFIGSVAVLGTGALGTTTGLVGGTVVGISTPIVAINFFDSINPIRIYKDGKTEHLMIVSVNELLQTGEASVIIFQDTDVDVVLDAADRVEGILTSLDEQ